MRYYYSKLNNISSCFHKTIFGLDGTEDSALKETIFEEYRK